MTRTVSEVVSQQLNNKIWLCPSVVSCKTFRIHPLLKGIECTKSTVPQDLRNMKVEKYFSDCDFFCVIWINDGTLQAKFEKEYAEAVY